MHERPNLNDISGMLEEPQYEAKPGSKLPRERRRWLTPRVGAVGPEKGSRVPQIVFNRHCSTCTCHG